MASDPSHPRINQFFTSKKKRKFLSPAVKTGRAEKDAKKSIGGSPGCIRSSIDKSTSSQDNENLMQNQNLRVEIGSSVVVNHQNDQSYLVAQSKVSGCSSVSHVNTASGQPSEIVEHPELKQFATDFMSLYCSDVPLSESSSSKVNSAGLDKHAYPPGTDRRKTCMEDELVSSDDKNSKQIQSSSSAKDGILKSIREVVSGGDNVKPQISLKKCSSMKADKFDTPIRETEARETPKSTSGNSIFSPGEAFWNEAIQLADGLFAPSDNISNQVVGFAEVSEGHQMINDSKNSRCNGGLKMELDVKIAPPVASSVSKHEKGLNKEVSPMPVKHFDFSFDDQHLDKESPHHPRMERSHVLEGEKGACALINNNGLRSKDNNLICFTKEKDNGDLLLTEGSSAVKFSKLKHIAKKDSDQMISDSPELKFSIANHDANAENTPSSFATLKDCLDLSNWLPSEICSVYKKKGILKLYPWQVDCLQVDGVLNNRNLVYCASTSAGKSFVAEILMLRRVLSSGKMALLVLPYVSICAEKADHLEVLMEPLGKHVRSYYGNQGGGNLPKDTSIAVCTIEKANSLINRLLEEGRLSELGIIVIDELHMVGDQSRGYLLELMLTKLRYAAGEGNTQSSSDESSGISSGKTGPAQGLQIVGMSATLPNVAAIADWLQAALYQTDFRPVPLVEYIKIGNTIYNKEMNIIRTISKSSDLGGRDPDHIAELCNEVVREGNSVLIFCSTRKGCESTASHVARYLKKFPGSPTKDQSWENEITYALDELRRSPSGLDPVLEETLPAGVAYHHAGLTVEERETVEACYRKGLVRVLTATSTLAAGVNLPARRVIFRQPRIGRDFIDGTRYRQMAGRAGRTGIDTKGESVLICKPEEAKRILGLLNDACPPLHSCLSEDKNGMTHAILEVVAGGIVQTATDIHRYVRCTLLNATKPFDDVVKSAQDALKWLCHKRFLEWSDETKLYTTTPLGRASFGSSLCPEESLIVLDDLLRAREGFVLASDLHLVYLVTPINVGVEPDWELYYGRFMELSSLDQSVGNRVGVQEPFLMRMAHGVPIRSMNKSRQNNRSLQNIADNRSAASNSSMHSEEQTLRVCKRFYVALVLSRLVQEVPVGEVCEAFKVARGMVQSLQENAGRFASMVSVFCERLGWQDFELLVFKFQNRVSFGVRAEIVELTSIPYVKGSRARALYKAGLRTPQAIAEASLPDIGKALFESSSWAAEGTAQRRIQLGVVKKIKNGARKIVLEKAEEARLTAFSAFKSLGLDVPPIFGPLSSNLPVKVDSKETTKSSGEESTTGIAGFEHSKSVQIVASVGGNARKDKIISEIEDGKSAKKSIVGPGMSSVAPLADNMLCDQRVGDPAPKVDGSFKCNGTINSTIPSSLVLQDVDCADNMHLSHQSGCNGIRESSDNPDNMRQQQIDKDGVHCGSNSVTDKGVQNATSVSGGFDSFLDLWESSGDFFFDIHFNKRSGLNATTSFEIHGIAVCWDCSPVYYINLPKDLCSSRRNEKLLSLDEQLDLAKERWNRVRMILGRNDTKKFTWNMKVQVQLLKHPAVSIHRFGSLSTAIKSMGLDIIDNSFYLLRPIYIRDAIDLSIVAWTLWPDEERSSNPNLEKEVKKRLSSEAAAAATKNGRWKNQMRRAAHNGCCRRVAQTRALTSVLWKLLISEKLLDALLRIEVPLVTVIAQMELWGIGVDMEKCLHARQILGKKLKYLENQAYKLAGLRFSLYTAADIANVLYERLKLPVPEGYNKGKQHPSTDKHCLDLLRNEHPIIPIIKEHRTLAKLLNCTLGSICALARLSMSTQRYTLHGHWLQTSTATGRLSMEEPNLQCVEHEVDLQLIKCDGDNSDNGVECYKINARDFFIPTEENWLLLTADYSQIELRLMAHFSRDTSLIELLNNRHDDVFTMIAARWAKKLESSVTIQERDLTKRLVYGILYGMGANTLAEQLDCSSEEAAEKIRSFKRSFPGVASWLKEAVASCRRKGYVETLKGRKRFLANIKIGNSEEKSKAQRQAVNSICQGSAADIIKIAMSRIYSLIIDEDDPYADSELDNRFEMLKGRCRILLQVHDELVLETDPSVINEAALLLKTSMENAASLLVPLHVKLKVGRTWGSLEPFLAEET
ncbi:DNA-directed DNA polymerase [Lithospermum erythrorhizon]|uniref:DNA-directed DNA polymerase n=1 Tax=Lithospermum erythrorhizon TaxID=34254 RepID=A0AAV3P0C2_LITER